MVYSPKFVAGIIYLASDVNRDTLPAQISQCPLPLGGGGTITGKRRVLRDNQQVASLATRYLIECGHRYIAYLGDQEGNLIRQQRLVGFRNTLTRYGITHRYELVPARGDDTHAASIATRQLLENNNAITALLCHSPDAMIGCIDGIHKVGRTVGKDVFLTQQVALIGFEDMLHINLTSPAFTYVSSASEESGRQAATLIIRKIKEPTLQNQTITLSGQLVARESA